MMLPLNPQVSTPQIHAVVPYPPPEAVVLTTIVRNQPAKRCNAVVHFCHRGSTRS